MRKLREVRDRETVARVSSVGGNIERFAVGNWSVFYPWQKNQGGCKVCDTWFGASLGEGTKLGLLRGLKATYITDKNVAHLKFYQPNNGRTLEYLMVLTVSKGKLEVSLLIEYSDGGVIERDILMPGFHPCFACRDVEEVEIEAGGEQLQVGLEGVKFFPLASREIKISIPGKRNILMKLGENFSLYGDPKLALRSDSPKKYFYAEPFFEDDNSLKLWRKFLLEISFEVC